MSVAWTFAEALKAAGKDLTRDSFVKAVESTKYQGPGLVELTYSSSDHGGYEGTQMGVIKNGTIELSGDPQDVSSDLTVSKSSYTQAKPADAGILPASAIPSS